MAEKIALTDYASALDLLVECRECAKDLAQKSRTLEKLKAREQISGALSSGVHATKLDYTAATDARLDLERKWADDIAHDNSVISLVYSLLWGAEKSDGLAGLLGFTYSMTLYNRYIAYMSWSKTAENLGYSVRHLQRLEKIALEFMDSNGLEETAQGVGLAI